MSVSSVSTGSTYTVLSALADASKATIAEEQQRDITLVQQDLQKQLNIKVAQIKAEPASATITILQSALTSANSQDRALTSLQTETSNNSTLLLALQSELSNLQASATAGDSSGFDNTLGSIATYVGDLTVLDPNNVLTPDGVPALKSTGLSIGSSNSYDLSTTAGQAQATTDIQNAQVLLNNIASVTTNNSIIIGSAIDSVAKQLDNLNTQITTDQTAQSAATAAKIKALNSQAQIQSHLLQLQIGGSLQVANELSSEQSNGQATNSSSVFSILQKSVGATTTSRTLNGHSDPILSLFA